VIRTANLPYYLHLIFIALALSLTNQALTQPKDSLLSKDSKNSVYETDQVEKLINFEGKIIRSIKIIVKDVFEEPVDYSIYRLANRSHIDTKEFIVRSELLFKEGEPFSAFKMKESERILRQLRWQRNPEIRPKLDGEFVDIEVITQDTWTLIPNLNYSSGDGSGNRSVGITESNLLGLGKRLEFLVSETENRRTFEGVYDDWRLMNSDLRMVLANFYRADGNRFVGLISKPYRTLLDTTSWTVSGESSDTVGKLWSGGEERFIYRQNTLDWGARYSVSYGPREKQRRYSVGFDYQDTEFEMPTAKDFEDADVDPDQVSNDINLLAENRKYIGPTFGYESLEPRYVRMAYIDRFDRPDDFDLGDNFSAFGTAAMESFGSIKDALIFNLTRTGGKQFSKDAFIRGEFGLSGRYTDSKLENGLFRAQSTYYNVLGDTYIQDTFMGLHTLAFGYTLDYGHNLDKDREFLLGADNGLRGYDARSFTGDKRFVMNLEDRIVLKEDLWRLMSFGVAGFVDVGGSTDESFRRLFREDLFADVGIGLRFAFPRSSGGRTLRIDFAVPFRDGPDGTTGYEFRIIFAGGQAFNSRTRSEISGAEKANVEVGTDQ
jgi:outer membrane protein assembly factor BamA